MVYVLTLIKALTLGPEINVGDYTLCPDQIPEYSDEELDCRVTAIAPEAGIVILVRDGAL